MWRTRTAESSIRVTWIWLRPLILGDIAGGIGSAEELGEIAVAADNRNDADARGDLEDLSFPLETVLANRIEHGLSVCGGFVGVTVHEQHPELVAAEPGEGVALRNDRTQDRRELAQKLVSGSVAAGVVDQLEFVEIQIAQDVLTKAVRRVADRIRQPKLELATVDQAGQRIVAREVLHALLQGPQLRDVGEDQDRSREVMVLGNDRSGTLANRELRTVFEDQK